MLKADYHRNFYKDYKNLHVGIQSAFDKRLGEFLQNPKSPLLYDHSLKGHMKGKRSFSVTGDVRTIYRYLDEQNVLLLRVGPHNKVYG